MERPRKKRRGGLFDEAGKRIRGKGNKQAADLALTRVQVAAGFKLTPVREPVPSKASQPWIVANVCSEYLQYCERRVSTGNMGRDHRQSAILQQPDFKPLRELNRRVLSHALSDSQSSDSALQTIDLAIKGPNCR